MSGMIRQSLCYFLVLSVLFSAIECLSKSASVDLNGVKIQLQNTGTFTFPSDNKSTRIILQFNAPLSPAERDIYISNNIHFEQYIHPNAYIVTATTDAYKWLQNNKPDVGAAHLPAKAKIGFAVRKTLEATPKSAVQIMDISLKKVLVMFHPGTMFNQAKQALLNHGAILCATQTRFDYHQTMASVAIPRNSIDALAEEDCVMLITEIEPPIVPCNINAQDTSNIDEIQPDGSTGYNLGGSGVTVGVWDPSGVRTTHTELIGRAKQVDNAKVSHYHSTHVAGTIGASGINGKKTRGMAPNVNLLCWNSSADIYEMDANAHRITASNHSYSSAVGWEFNEEDNKWHWYGNTDVCGYQSHWFGMYSTHSRAFDKIVYDHDLLIVVSAGNNRNQQPPVIGASYILNDGPETSNEPRGIDGEEDDGYDTMNPISLGKNVIAVGAINDILIEPPTPELSTITSWSSWGPSDDGRIKPDVVANGSKLLSLGIMNDKATTLLSGTSMAAPVVTGAIACLTQKYKQQFGGSEPIAAVMKGILIHTAQDGGTDPGPDYRIGWGLVDAKAAADFIHNFSNDDTNIINDYYSDSEIQIPGKYSGEGPIKVTLTWIDPPGMITTSGMDYSVTTLVNDLDISITDKNNEYFPWTLDPGNPSASAKQDAENHRDNVEQVFIASPSSATYTIRIGGQVNLGAYQNFTLCVSGLKIMDNDTKLLILQPQRRITAGIVPVHMYATSKVGISKLVIELDGEVLDNPYTVDIEGEVEFEQDQLVVNHRIQWDTRYIPTGEHNLAMSITDASGFVFSKDIPVLISNDQVLAPLQINQPPITSELNMSHTRDWYSIKVQESGFYTIKTSSASNLIYPDTEIVLYGPDNKNLVLAEDDDSGPDTFSTITQYLDQESMYFVSVNGYTSLSEGFYGISIEKYTENPVEPEIIPLIVNGPAVSNQFNDIGDEHWYEFLQSDIGTIIIEASAGIPAPGKFFQFSLYNPSDPTRSLMTGTLSNPILLIMSKDQKYLLRVTSPKSNGRYNISVNTLATFSTKNLELNGNIKYGVFNSGRIEENWYIIQPFMFSTYMMEFRTDSDDLAESTTVSLYGPDDPTKYMFSTNTNGSYSARLFMPLLSNHIYYLHVITKKGNGEYSVQIRNPEEVYPFTPTTPYQPKPSSDSQAGLIFSGNIETAVKEWMMY